MCAPNTHTHTQKDSRFHFSFSSLISSRSRLFMERSWEKANFVHIHYTLYTEPSGTILRQRRKNGITNVSLEKNEFIEFAHRVCIDEHNHMHTCHVSLPLLVCLAYVYVLAHRSLLHHRIILWHCLCSSFSFQPFFSLSCVCFLAKCAQFALVLALNK